MQVKLRREEERAGDKGFSCWSLSLAGSHRQLWSVAGITELSRLEVGGLAFCIPVSFSRCLQAAPGVGGSVILQRGWQ